jgi:DNA-binding helix-hairpin-helix protein with protein kinase domain
MFAVGTKFFAEGDEYRCDSILGYGGQATVWKVKRVADGQLMALKLFNKAPTGRGLDKHVERLLRVCKAAREVAEALPEAQVCFPRAIYREKGAFGVLMELASGVSLTHSSLFCNPQDQPETYCSPALRAVQVGELQYWHFLLAAFHLSHAIAVIHRYGMTHCDLSLGNVSIDPSNGRICLIDCDNLACGNYMPANVYGTPGFRAPELINSSLSPSPNTDQHPLAVLLYYLAMFRHPLLGSNHKVNPAYPENESSIFGAGAIFSDHPKIKSNRFKYGLPFETLPTFLQSLFIDCFVSGLQEPTRRPQSMVWARAFWQALENMTICTRCKQRFFLTDRDASCLFCGERNPRQRWRFRFNNGRHLLAEPGRKLYEHHLRDMEFRFQTPLAEVRMLKGDTAIKNLSTDPWKMRLASGGMLICNPGQAFRFNGVSTVEFGQGRSAIIEQVP